ncbi:wall-associated receptor kinase-like 14 isoform X1 [Populus alba x Populus x berolinensis]|uniref:Wall-associated receptor kinase-like 14 isoform X1 n=1 Tax=Populus alba x Populus x berolinensis TaxID=444605 RepID=A0AAD6QGR8_9ROSI|nr:wall-associated receptor kinase-like 14 isoform X1 [Populus alba x Populus x berolinensis]
MILQQESLVLFITIITIFIAATSSPTQKSNSSACESSCGTGKSVKVVPYPFGFSGGCPIILQCDHTAGDVKIGEFHVQNITPNVIVTNILADCNRSIARIKPLFGKNFAPSLNNSLLLQNCNKTLNSCVIPTSSLRRDLKLANCGDQNYDLNCYSQRRRGFDTLRYENMTSTTCKSVFSSLFIWWEGSAVSFQFERFELEWWLEGDYNTLCSNNANHTKVKLSNGGVGLRCHCADGFAGDGFAAGKGCRKGFPVSKCSASKYMSGECGGTTRVGVLVGVFAVTTPAFLTVHFSGFIAGALLMAGLAFLCFYIRRKSTSLRNRLSAKRLLCEAAGNSSVPFFQYKDIEKATNGFSEKQRLGIGAYGTVYAGKLNSDDLVAIKKLRHRDTDSIDQVMNEIKLLSSVSHPNLVRLLGCCIEEGEPILVYEFMPNGTLCEHLQQERGTGLPWTVRLTVATETAKAIAYLHSVINPPIYHRDIKSSNILLDYNYRSKVADFGLSRLGMVESSHISTAPQGTPGYLDPQYHQYFHLSDKSDVYSFGVVLVEIITALKAVDFSRPHSEVNLAALAIDRIGRGCVDEIIDPYLDPNRDAWTLTSILSVAELAFRCLAFHRDMRPTMLEVAEELEQIRLSAWIPTMYMASPTASSCSSQNGSQKSLSVSISRKAGLARGKLLLPQRTDSLTSLEETKDSSPVSEQDTWLSEQSSPSTNSLLGNVVR